MSGNGNFVVVGHVRYDISSDARRKAGNAGFCFAQDNWSNRIPDSWPDTKYYRTIRYIPTKLVITVAPMAESEQYIAIEHIQKGNNISGSDTPFQIQAQSFIRGVRETAWLYNLLLTKRCGWSHLSDELPTAIWRDGISCFTAWTLKFRQKVRLLIVTWLIYKYPQIFLCLFKQNNNPGSTKCSLFQLFNSPQTHLKRPINRSFKRHPWQ